ncbi:hypothetical protein PGTUg99_013002 [Puccinia graminis f. sp. tritici]|uniref:Uncharacterized protein n=1 Tax=Puccinia graminis f. sp. tritici TaxID=56615 RepID=A0A5B0QQK6_PUCGR|nr:hypothetical protein PGTUg99_000321 [Puccinia graminis f. sp. tritici]KAA1115616.1 hypothetical protein PGTUg99_013002 [Puccinia graminis f. sp. tritici]
METGTSSEVEPLDSSKPNQADALPFQNSDNLNDIGPTPYDTSRESASDAPLGLRAPVRLPGGSWAMLDVMIGSNSKK